MTKMTPNYINEIDLTTLDTEDEVHDYLEAFVEAHKPPEKMGTYQFIINPKASKAFLRRNVGNRKVTHSHKKYINGQLNNKNPNSPGWVRRSGNSIKFDWNGHLADGQYRLGAISFTGNTEEETVTFGIDPDARPYIDSGKRKTNGEQLDHYGIPHPSKMYNILKWIHGYELKLEEPMTTSGLHSQSHWHSYAAKEFYFDIISKYRNDGKNEGIAWDLWENSWEMGQLNNTQKPAHITQNEIIVATHFIITVMQDTGSEALRSLYEPYFNQIITGVNIEENSASAAVRHKLISNKTEFAKLNGKSRKFGKEFWCILDSWRVLESKKANGSAKKLLKKVFKESSKENRI